MLVNGTQEEKLEWTFHLYDLDGDGVISREEMEDVVISVILHFNFFLDLKSQIRQLLIRYLLILMKKLR